MRLRPLLFALCLMSTCGAAHAQTPPLAPAADAAAGQRDDDLPRVQWTGFGTLGYTQVSSEQLRGFARDQTQDAPSGFGVDSRLGVQLNAQFSPRWSATAQVVASQRARQARLEESLEWGFVSYLPASGWLLRAGRTSPDIFLNADVRNVGFAWPWVRPSQEFYAWMPMKSMDGLDLSHSWRDAGAQWRLKAAVGQASATTVDQARGGAAVVKIRDLATLTLSRESGPWTWKASYLRGQVDFHSLAWLQPLHAGLDLLATVPVPDLAAEVAALQHASAVVSQVHYAALALQYDQGPWLIQAEHSWQGGATRQSASRHAYVSLAHRWHQFTGFVLVGASRPDEAALQAPNDWVGRWTPYLGAQGAAQADGLARTATAAANGLRFSQRTLGVGVRWDLGPTSSLKTQWDRVQVDAGGGTLWHRLSDEAANSRVLSVALDFVF
jgi:hypothetical protein